MMAVYSERKAYSVLHSNWREIEVEKHRDEDPFWLPFHSFHPSHPSTLAPPLYSTLCENKLNVSQSLILFCNSEHVRRATIIARSHSQTHLVVYKRRASIYRSWETKNKNVLMSNLVICICIYFVCIWINFMIRYKEKKWNEKLWWKEQKIISGFNLIFWGILFYIFF